MVALASRLASRFEANSVRIASAVLLIASPNRRALIATLPARFARASLLTRSRDPTDTAIDMAAHVEVAEGSDASIDGRALAHAVSSVTSVTLTAHLAWASGGARAKPVATSVGGQSARINRLAFFAANARKAVFADALAIVKDSILFASNVCVNCLCCKGAQLAVACEARVARARSKRHRSSR